MIDYERKKDYVRMPRDIYEEFKKLINNASIIDFKAYDDHYLGYPESPLPLKCVRESKDIVESLANVKNRINEVKDV